jgi:hypothetical protein
LIKIATKGTSVDGEEVLLSAVVALVAAMGAMPLRLVAVTGSASHDPAIANSRVASLPSWTSLVWTRLTRLRRLFVILTRRPPVVIFANWRGFSGGSRDMAGEILKFGAMIDALREYSNPVYIAAAWRAPWRILGGCGPTKSTKKMEMC